MIKAQSKRALTKSQVTYATRLPEMGRVFPLKSSTKDCIVPQSLSSEKTEVILSNLVVFHIVERTIPRYTMIDDR